MNRLIARLYGKRLPSIDLAHVDLSGAQGGWLCEANCFPDSAPKGNYEMTPLGRMKPLLEWAEAHHSEIRSVRKKYVTPEARKAL